MPAVSDVINGEGEVGNSPLSSPQEKSHLGSAGQSEVQAMEGGNLTVNAQGLDAMEMYGGGKVGKGKSKRTTGAIGTGAAGSKADSKSQAAFVHKLYSMIQTPELQSHISWSENGTVFSVYNPTEFSRAVLPQFFKHNNFQSFVRQLNMYGFHKVNDLFSSTPTATSPSLPEGIVAWEFQHASFRRDRPELLSRIKRKSSKPLVAGTIAIGSSTGARRNASASGSNTSSRDSPVNGMEKMENIGSGYGSGTNPRPGVFSAPNDYNYHNGSSFSNPNVSSRDYAGHQQGEFNTGNVQHIGGDQQQMLHHRPAPSSTTSYPHSQSSAYLTRPYPSPSNSDAVVRQVAGLDAQIRGLTEALYHSQQEIVSSRSVNYTVMRMMLGLVASLDSNDERRTEIEATHAALSKLHPDALRFPSSSRPSPQSAQTQLQQSSAFPFPSPSYSAGSNYAASPQWSEQHQQTMAGAPTISTAAGRAARPPSVSYQRSNESYARGGDAVQQLQPLQQQLSQPPQLLGQQRPPQALLHHHNSQIPLLSQQPLVQQQQLQQVQQNQPPSQLQHQHDQQLQQNMHMQNGQMQLQQQQQQHLQQHLHQQQSQVSLPQLGLPQNLPSLPNGSNNYAFQPLNSFNSIAPPQSSMDHQQSDPSNPQRPTAATTYNLPPQSQSQNSASPYSNANAYPAVATRAGSLGGSIGNGWQAQTATSASPASGGLGGLGRRHSESLAPLRGAENGSRSRISMFKNEEEEDEEEEEEEEEEDQEHEVEEGPTGRGMRKKMRIE